MIPITVAGVTYNSISAAWREVAVEGLPEITVRWRLKNGWSPDQAFKTPAVVPTDRRTFAEVRSKFDEVING